jgi:hypothetical protein
MELRAIRIIMSTARVQYKMLPTIFGRINSLLCLVLVYHWVGGGLVHWNQTFWLWVTMGIFDPVWDEMTIFLYFLLYVPLHGDVNNSVDVIPIEG